MNDAVRFGLHQPNPTVAEHCRHPLNRHVLFPLARSWTVGLANRVAKWALLASLILIGILDFGLPTRANASPHLSVRDLAVAAIAANPLGAERTLVSQGTVGEYNSVAVRANGRPIISFNGSLRIYDCATPTCSSGTTRELETGLIWYNDIAIRANGRPIISYVLPLSGLSVFDCIDAACSSGTARPLDSGGISNTSIAIRLDGRPIISYLDDQSNADPLAVDVKVYDCADSSCATGAVRTITEYPGNVTSQTDIAIRPDGRPIIGYFHDGPDDMAVYDCNNEDCTSGSTRFVDTVGSVGHDTSIAIGTTGLPIMSYWDASFALKVFACADTDCTTGDDHELDRESGVIVGHETSITVPSDGLPLISYHDQTNGTLKIFDCDASDCSTGTARTLDIDDDDTGVGVGDNTTIIIGANDLPLISYWDRDNRDLKLFTCGDPRCEFNAIDLLLFADGFENP